VTRRRKSQPKSADRGADAQPSARCRMTAKESFDLADVIGASAGTGPFSCAPLLRSADPRRPHHIGVAPHTLENTIPGGLHPFRRHAPAAPSTCMLGTWANEQLTCEPRPTHRRRCKTFEALQLCPRTTVVRCGIFTARGSAETARFDQPIEPMTLGRDRSRLGTQKRMRSRHLRSPRDGELMWNSWSWASLCFSREWSRTSSDHAIAADHGAPSPSVRRRTRQTRLLSNAAKVVTTLD
jgi:hypothetical protein